MEIAGLSVNEPVRHSWRTLGLGLGLALAWLLCAQSAEIAAAVWALRDLAAGPTPWLVAPHALLLYVQVPAAAIAGSFLLFGPGLLIALRLDGGQGDFGAWLLRGFALTLVGLSVVLGVFEALFHVTLTGSDFATFLAALCAAALVPVALADLNGRIAWSMFARRRWDIAAMLAVPLAAFYLMSPKFFWEAFNGDGAHLFLSAQNLIHTGSPFWDSSAGPVAAYPSITTLIEVLPNAWFQRLFGGFELSVRLPALPGLAILAGLVLDLVRRGHADLPGRAAAIGVTAALTLYAWVLGWHASYDVYFADIALPMTREPFVMIAFLGFLRFFLDERFGWMAIFAALSYAAIPSAPIYFLLCILAVGLTESPRPWRRLAVAVGIVAAVILAGRYLPAVLSALHLSGARDEFSADNLAERLRFVTPFEPQRMLFWILPCGILPALSLAAWRRQDRLGHAVTLVTLGYATFFYLQGYRILPHHFAPAMVLPLIVFWRLDLVQRAPQTAAIWALGFAAVAALLSQPGSYRPHLFGREFAATIAIDGATGSPADNPALMRISQDLLRDAFPMSWGENAWKTQYLGAPLAWYAEATQPKPAGQDIVYEIRPASGAPLRDGQTVLASQDGYELIGNDAGKYAADRNHAGLERTIGPLYYVRRAAVFASGSRGWPRPVIDLFGIDKAIDLKGTTK